MAVSSDAITLSSAGQLKGDMTNKSTEEDEVHIRRMLKEAFADVPCPDSFKKAGSCGLVIHDVCLELRRDFYNYQPEEIHYMLPFVLEDLMITRTGDDIETNDAEFLIFQLDPYGIDDNTVRATRLEQFANFTQEQARAVCEWLRLARTWDDLKMFTNYVDAAIVYWCQHHAKDV